MFAFHSRVQELFNTKAFNFIHPSLSIYNPFFFKVVPSQKKGGGRGERKLGDKRAELKVGPNKNDERGGVGRGDEGNGNGTDGVELESKRGRGNKKKSWG